MLPLNTALSFMLDAHLLLFRKVAKLRWWIQHADASPLCNPAHAGETTSSSSETSPNPSQPFCLVTAGQPGRARQRPRADSPDMSPFTKRYHFGNLSPRTKRWGRCGRSDRDGSYRADRTEVRVATTSEWNKWRRQELYNLCGPEQNRPRVDSIKMETQTN